MADITERDGGGDLGRIGGKRMLVVLLLTLIPASEEEGVDVIFPSEVILFADDGGTTFP
jgi:hypothetical protein